MYTSCAYATMSVFVVCDVCACGHRVRSIRDSFACLDRWMSLLLTDNASPGSLHGMLLRFLVEEGRGMEKLVIVAIHLIYLLKVWTGNS